MLLSGFTFPWGKKNPINNSKICLHQVIFKVLRGDKSFYSVWLPWWSVLEQNTEFVLILGVLFSSSPLTATIESLSLQNFMKCHKKIFVCRGQLQSKYCLRGSVQGNKIERIGKISSGLFGSVWIILWESVGFDTFTLILLTLTALMRTYCED